MEITGYKTKQRSVVTTIMFLIGTRENLLKHSGNDLDAIEDLFKNKNAVIFRSLCNIRSNLMSTYINTENSIKYELKNLDRQEIYIEDIKILEENDVHIIKANHRVNEYLVDINGLIGNRLESIKELFPEWINWNYIKNLFTMPKGNDEKSVSEESKKYSYNRMKYPFSRYINWNPQELGNILENDNKFLKILYAQNNDQFYDNSKVFDASEDVKTNIYDFIEDSESLLLAVDCENSDAYKLAAVLTQLNDEETRKINKIILYDDEHTTKAWQFLNKMTDIPVEHIVVDRIKDNKSLVDMKICAGISAAYYRDNIKSFILVSSDSDYWALISSISDAKFLVMIEYAKCSSAIKQAFVENHIYYCSIDDFCDANINNLKTAVLKDALKERIDNNILGTNAKELVDEIYEECRLTTTDTEKRNFYNKYIKNLSLQIDDDGKFYIRLPM